MFFKPISFFLSRLSIHILYNSSIQLSNLFSTFLCVFQTNVKYWIWNLEARSGPGKHNGMTTSEEIKELDTWRFTPWRSKKVKLVFYLSLFSVSLSILTINNSSIKISNPFSTFCVCFRQTWNIGYGTWKQEVDLENIMG